MDVHTYTYKFINMPYTFINMSYTFINMRTYAQIGLFPNKCAPLKHEACIFVGDQHA